MSSGGSVRVSGVPTAPGANGSVPLRRELRELQTGHPEEFNLFILGLRLLQGKPKEDPTSYYQIAGIHGRPYKPWDNAQSSVPWESFGGYCTHSSILFLPWHRPYLALFEQSLQKAVQDIAGQFPSNVRSRYVELAKNFRLPYWDFAARIVPGAAHWPIALSARRIAVLDVDGRNKTIDNPLFSFNIDSHKPASDDFSSDWRRYPGTVRWPDANGRSRDRFINTVLINESASRSANLSLLLLAYNDFDAVSNNRWNGPGNNGNFGSLENVHDAIHGTTGGNFGHMSSINMSAFDPVFWLLHCNVDRLWAMWQALHPAEYLSPRPSDDDTFVTLGGTIEDENTPLAPFWDASGTKFWTSVQVKNSATFGYAYQETQPWAFATTDNYQESIRQEIARLYGGNPFQNFVQTVAQSVPTSAARISLAGQLTAAAVEDKKPSVVTVTSLADKEPQVPLTDKKDSAVLKVEEPPNNPVEPVELTSPEGPIPESLQHLAPNNQYTEWIVNVRTEKHGLGQTYNVLFFDGSFDDDPASWPLEFNVVGRFTVLGRGPASTCARCREGQAANLITTGIVPLTSALLQDIRDGELASLEPSSVVPHLRDNLRWRVTLADGTSQPLDQVPGLKVSVTSVSASIDDNGVPVYSDDYTTHTSITAGKPAGLTDDDD